MGATVITKVGVGAALVGTGVDVVVAGTGVVAASPVAVGVGGGVTGAWSRTGPMSSSPQSAPAWARPVKSPSPAAFIASAIWPGPPSWSKRHRIPSRSSGRIPIIDAAASHSSSFRHAIVTESAVMLPAMALPGSPSMPAVMTVLGSMTANPARTQSDVSWLSGPGPGTNPARKSRAIVSSARHPMNLACSSLDAWPGPASDRASFSGSSPIHSSSVSASSESIAPESCSRRGASTPGGAGVVVGSGVGGLAGVALGAAVGLSVGRGLGGNRGVSGRRCCGPGRYLGRSRDFFRGRCCVGAGCQGRQGYQESDGCQ